jgi:hypothetical protein
LAKSPAKRLLRRFGWRFVFALCLAVRFVKRRNPIFASQFASALFLAVRFNKRCNPILFLARRAVARDEPPTFGAFQIFASLFASAPIIPPRPYFTRSILTGLLLASIGNRRHSREASILAFVIPREVAESESRLS